MEEQQDAQESEIKGQIDATATLRAERQKGYRQGLIAGVSRYAWWGPDRKQYVGNQGITLKLALKEIEAEMDSNDNRLTGKLP